MAKSILPCLMFEGQAEEAMTFYVALFPGSSIGEVSRLPAETADSPGMVQKAVFTLGQQTVLCINSPVPHEFTFTPAFSFFIECESEAEITQLVAALGERGAALMPLDNYGFSRQFAWLNDRFGVSWQLNLT